MFKLISTKSEMMRWMNDTINYWLINWYKQQINSWIAEWLKTSNVTVPPPAIIAFIARETGGGNRAFGVKIENGVTFEKSQWKLVFMFGVRTYSRIGGGVGYILCIFRILVRTSYIMYTVCMSYVFYRAYLSLVHVLRACIICIRLSYVRSVRIWNVSACFLSTCQYMYSNSQ